ncbi:hypothetical protein B0H10DRAFT_2079796 [Mycena sp. CBHHK59/15]|nr:hypothetical protein B0H10DRAFT_2120353 [Mycena sp. CBHHK59/15]KAJ6603028.1 hypothetical protein B0H10DRAFT_2079796 [Mycena sp. CBHHK59/15]
MPALPMTLEAVMLLLLACQRPRRTTTPLYSMSDMKAVAHWRGRAQAIDGRESYHVGRGGIRFRRSRCVFSAQSSASLPVLPPSSCLTPSRLLHSAKSTQIQSKPRQRLTTRTRTAL